MSSLKLKFVYDNNHDVMHIIDLGKSQPNEAEEPEKGIIVKHSTKTGEVTGITVMDWKLKIRHKKIHEVLKFFDWEETN